GGGGASKASCQSIGGDLTGLFASRLAPTRGMHFNCGSGPAREGDLMTAQIPELSSTSARLSRFIPRAPTMAKGMSLFFLLLISASAHAENWPGQQWTTGPTIRGSALEALEGYAFPTRNDTTRQGIRTDALLVIRDGQL